MSDAVRLDLSKEEKDVATIALRCAVLNRWPPTHEGVQRCTKLASRVAASCPFFFYREEFIDLYWSLVTAEFSRMPIDRPVAASLRRRLLAERQARVEWGSV